MNIILRRCLAMLKLTMIKRDYFDPAETQPIRVSGLSWICNLIELINISNYFLNKFAWPLQQHGLTVWPGYLTSIRHHETRFLLGVDIINKVVRDATAYDVMESIRKNHQGVDLVVSISFNCIPYNKFGSQLTRSLKICFKKRTLLYLEIDDCIEFKVIVEDVVKYCRFFSRTWSKPNWKGKL